ncbi:MAG: NAD-dependent epimerase/dehydratase family protein, partial [Victivallales bacterium]|nr:NAD-dependent epimerase/dehydratase family protein [Victivallales bacterium]
PATKAAAEKLALHDDDRNLAVAALRPHLIWGPRDPHLLPRVVAAARAGRLAIVGDGHNRVDLTYAANAARAHVLAAEYLAEHPGVRKTYFISDDAPVELWDWSNRMLARLGIAPVTRRIPYRLAYGLGAVLEAVYRLMPRLGEPPMTRFVAGQLAFSHYFDIGAARRDLGYRPVIPPETALERTAAWLKEAGI